MEKGLAFDPTMSINLEEIEQFITSSNFTDFLVIHTDFSVAAFILQTLLDKVKELKE